MRQLACRQATKNVNRQAKKKKVPRTACILSVNLRPSLTGFFSVYISILDLFLHLLTWIEIWKVRDLRTELQIKTRIMRRPKKNVFINCACWVSGKKSLDGKIHSFHPFDCFSNTNQMCVFMPVIIRSLLVAVFKAMTRWAVVCLLLIVEIEACGVGSLILIYIFNTIDLSEQ